jgi:flagellar hook-basal body complex protein FliE
VAPWAASAEPARAATPSPASTMAFAKLLKQGIDSVNQTQARATDLATRFERGVPGVELPQVMLEMQKANVSFRALTEVRNKFVDAYREIMNMPL